MHVGVRDVKMHFECGGWYAELYVSHVLTMSLKENEGVALPDFDSEGVANMLLYWMDHCEESIPLSTTAEMNESD